MRDPRRTVVHAVRNRTHRIHPPDADRGRDRGGGSRRGRRHPVHAVHPRHRLHRGGQGHQPAGPELVPALRDAQTGNLLRPGGMGQTRGIRHPDVHRRHPRRGRPPPRQAQRFLDPAADLPGNRARRPAPSLVVVRLPDHPEAGVRLPQFHGRHGGRAARLRYGSHHQPPGPRRHPWHVGREDHHQGCTDRHRRQETRRRWRRRHPVVQPRWPPARPCPGSVPPAAARGPGNRQGRRRDGGHRHHERRRHRGLHGAGC